MKSSEKNEEIEEQTVALVPNMGKMLVFKKMLHTMEGSKKEDQTFFTHGIVSMVMYVARLLIGAVALMLFPSILIDKLKLPTI